MSGEAKSEKSLKALEAKFRSWRRKRRPGTRIPEWLWASAVAEARIHGMWKVSKRLRLDYYGLKKRYAEAKPVPRVSETAAPVETNFVEVSWGEGREPECLVELEGPRGARLRVGLRGEGVAQIEKVTRLLWELAR